MQLRFRTVLALLTAAVLAAGGGGLRALHLVTDAATHAGHCQSITTADTCHHHHDDHGGHDHRDYSSVDHPQEFAPDGNFHSNHDESHDSNDDSKHREQSCSTCELLLALASTTGSTLPAPTFHALVAVADWPAPDCSPAPLPIGAVAARPPPIC